MLQTLCWQNRQLGSPKTCIALSRWCWSPYRVPGSSEALGYESPCHRGCEKVVSPLQVSVCSPMIGAQAGGLENIPSPKKAACPHQQSLLIPPHSSWQPLTHLRSLDAPVWLFHVNGITLSIVFEAHPCGGEGRGLALSWPRDTPVCRPDCVCPLPVDGHSHCFHFLAAVNPAAISVDKFLCGHEIVGPFGNCV